LGNIITGRSTSSEETADHVPYQTEKEREIEREREREIASHGIREGKKVKEAGYTI
jgi:hypothetical protein